MVITIGPLKRTKKRREERRRKLKEDELNERRRLMKNINTTETTTTMMSTTTGTNLPHELVLYNIFSRLPVDSLIRLSSVCKLWHNSLIHHRYNDLYFPSTHFLQSRRNPILMFHFFNVRYRASSFIDDIYFFYLTKEDGLVSSDINQNLGGGNSSSSSSSTIKLRSLVSSPNNCRSAIIGYCNGLVCVCQLFSECRRIYIVNPSRRDVIVTVPPTDVVKPVGYGFGFDSLTKEYKVVFIVNSAVDTEISKCFCLVYTLGRDSWRKITGVPNSLRLISTTTAKSAVSCNGALYWGFHDQKPHELLLFNLHDETFQLIRIPVDNEQVIRTKMYYYLEYKESLCLGRLEQLESKTCKVHLHILKDKIKQEWITETFHVPFPCGNATCIVTFCDQVFLYCFNGERFLFYNLHTKVPNVIQFPDDYSDNKHRNALCRSTVSHCHLYSHIENFISLRTFASRDAPLRYLSSCPDSSLVGKGFFAKISSSRNKN